jgi:hypothetical protein
MHLKGEVIVIYCIERRVTSTQKEEKTPWRGASHGIQYFDMRKVHTVREI